MAFLYPYFLFALAAVAVPIILHLVQLRRAKRIAFSNVKFIQVSKDLTASQRNLKELLILFCRILFIVFLVLAFAQPFIPASDAAVTVNDANLDIFVDNSYSMQRMHSEEDLTMLEVASDQAKTVLDLFPASTAFKLSSTSRLNHGAPLQKSEAISILDQLAYSAKPFAPSLGESIQASHLFIFSDFQKSSLKLEDFKSKDASMQVHLIPVSAAAASNITIDSVYLEDEFLRTDAESRIHVLVTNTSNDLAEDVPVKLFMQGQQVSALSLDLPPRQSTEAVMSFRATGEAISLAYVQVEDYPVEFDNTFYFTLSSSAAIAVTEVSDNTASLQQLYAGESFFKYSSYTNDNIDYAKLAASNIVIVNGVKALSAALAANLSNYAKEGGTLLIIPPVGSDRGAYTSLFQNLNMPVRFTGAGAGGAKTNLMAPDPNNPFFRSIFSDFDAKMQMPTASRSLSWSRASEDILRFRGGSPFLSRFDRGTGAVYLMAAPLDETYSSLPNHALFVPVMYRLAIESYQQQQQLAYTLNNNIVQVPAATKQQREGVYHNKIPWHLYQNNKSVAGNYTLLYHLKWKKQAFILYS
ncbi:BatA and WFA domain-containing protein [Pontibacter rugosus]